MGKSSGRRLSLVSYSRCLQSPTTFSSMEPVILFGGALILLAVYTFLSALRSLQTATFPKSVPVMGPRAELFSITRASFRQITGGIGTLLEGYRRHGQHDRPFVVYDPSAQQELLLPVKDLKWFAEQPDSKLSSHGVRNERHAVKYLHMGIELGTTMHFLERISGDRLARNLDALQPALHDELRTCIDRVFGLDTEEWREINVYSSLNDVVMPAISRAFLGLPLSRDPRVLNAFHRYIMALGLGTIFVGELPRFLKAVVARVVKLPLWYYRNKTLSILTPVVEAQLRRKTANPGEEGLEFVRACAKISEKNAVGGMGNAASAEVIAEWIMSLVSQQCDSLGRVDPLTENRGLLEPRRRSYRRRIYFSTWRTAPPTCSFGKSSAPRRTARFLQTRPGASRRASSSKPLRTA